MGRMERGILLLFTALWTLPAPALADGACTAGQRLKHFAHSVEGFFEAKREVLDNPFPGCQALAAPQSDLPSNARLRPENCDVDDVSKICVEAEKSCERLTGRASCFQTPGESDPCLDEPEIMQKSAARISYAAHRFYQLARDEKMLDHCCGQNARCRDGWPQTRIVLLKGLGPDDRTAHFDPISKNVEVSVSVLAGCRSRDCIDGYFFHELGHACQYWHHSGAEPTGLRYPVEQTRREIEDYLGPEGAQCVMDGLKARSSANHDTELDFAEWAEEALADAIFVGQWGTGAWARSCMAREDSLHAKAKFYSRCFLHYLPEVKNALCSAR
jgi:hypothetical protein